MGWMEGWEDKEQHQRKNLASRIANSLSRVMAEDGDLEESLTTVIHQIKTHLAKAYKKALRELAKLADAEP